MSGFHEDRLFILRNEG